MTYCIRLLVVSICMWRHIQPSQAQAIAARRREDVQPTITEHPENVVVPKNAPARLNCRAEGKPEPSISWLKDGYPMDMSTGSSHITLLDTGEMLFLSVSRLDVGTYQCIAENRAGATRSRNATLEVAFLRDDFRTDPSDSVGLAGEPVVLECQPPRGYPEPVVSWSKDGQDVNTDGDRVKVLQDGNLMISQARRTDTGSYVCIATNTIGTRQSPPAILNVHARPTFTRPAEDAIAAPGDTVDLHCVVEGDPIPTVTWSRMDGDLPQGRFQIGEDNSLHLRHVIQDDEGIYICRAENGWGAETMMVTLDVNTEPTFTTEPLDQTVSIGQVVSFECKVTGSPTPAIFWQKGGEQDLWYRGESYSNGRIDISEEGELEIQDVRLEDEGYYTCSALSVSGTADVSAYLTVLVPTSTIVPATPGQPPPVIRYVPSNQTYLSGAFGLIPCEATGDPDPVLQWSKNSAPIQTNSRIIVRDSGTLEIGNLYVSDTGLYTCTASNEWGQTSWSASLQVVVEPTSGSGVSLQSAPSLSQLPSPPGPLIPSNITKTTINLSWQQPSSDTPVTHYRLEYYSPQTASGWMLYSDHIEEDRVLVQQLRPGTTYLFLVRAVNDRGIGPPSPISQPITTRDSGRTSVVLQLAEAGVAIKNTLVLSNTEVKVIWQVDQHANLIEGFNLKHWINSNPDEVTVQVVIGATSKKLVGLQPDTHYTVAVQPFIGDVTGPDSPTASFITEDVVIRPGSSVLQNKLDTCGISIQSVEALDSTTLQVTWQVNRHTAYISGYHIRIQSLEVNWSNTITMDTESARSQLLTDLTPWTQYAVTITPYKGQYTGQESRVVIAKTGPDVPYSAPRSVFGESNGSSAILVGWLPPPVHMVPGILAGYNVYVLGNSSDQHKNVVAGNMSSSAMVTGLDQGKAYRVMVSAFTTAGSGPNSTEITVRVPPVLITDDLGGSITMIVSQPWFIATLASLMLITIIFITAWLWRRRQKQKQSSNITKASIGKDTGVMQNIGGVGPGTTAINQSNSQAWAETQSWLHTTASDGHDPEMCKQTLATTDCQIECKDANMSQLAESQRSSNFDASNPTLSTFQGSIPRQRGSPEYAVVESELHTPCCQGSYPRAPHLLCIHDTEPYASATLVLPPNIREYAARRQKCSDSSSNSGSGYNTQPTGVRKTSRSGLENVAYSSSGSGPPAVPKRDGSMPSASDCPSLPSDSGASSAGDRGSRKKNRHRGGSKQQPARNWTELLPPPPEQPPTDIDSPTGTTPCLAPCSHAPTTNAHMNQAPPCSHAPTNGHMDGKCCSSRMHPHMDTAPAPPIRQHHSMTPAYPNNDSHHTYPGGVPYDNHASHRPQPTNSLPNKLGNNRSGSPADRMQQSRHDVPDRPTEATQLHPGGSCLATKRLFEDPRHEQLGKELLEFNDDMSQSEILSDNDYAPMSPVRTRPVIEDEPVYQPQSLCLSEMDLPVRDDLETDVESESNCTDAMLGSWSSMNGSSSSGRHSSVSESSDGSFFTDADFASAVAAAAQSSGMNVVGSTVTDPRAGKKHSRRGLVTPKAGTNGMDGSNSGHYGSHEHSHRHGNQGGIKRVGENPHRPSMNTASTHPTLPIGTRQHRDKQNSVKKDQLILQDTNDMGLTVTANPMAFALEKKETLKV
ncbi:roundabout homolog 2-like isoform X1 [Asterias amurensis]|uniref:roundabout homolog 2-like isoform X1 n=1 Tax=Asterias amurensis TaxID=7602 RepID=UPI003AB4B582